MSPPAFGTEGEAKRFFVDRVLRQAELEGSLLSDAERRMLSWSESDPELDWSADEATALVNELATQMSDEQYEAKIAALLKGAYEREVCSDATAKAVWKEACSKLDEGDHYIGVMIDRALGRTLRARWFRWS